MRLINISYSNTSRRLGPYMYCTPTYVGSACGVGIGSGSRVGIGEVQIDAEMPA